MRDELLKLEEALNQAVTDQEKIDALNALARKLKHRDPQRGLALSQKAHDLAQAEAYPRGIAGSLLTCGQIYYQLGQYNRAQTYLSQALPIFEEEDDTAAQANIWNEMGLIQWRLADYAEAIAHHLQALALFRQANDKAGEGRALGNLGMVYGVTGVYDQAFAAFQKAVTAFEAIQNEEGIGFALNNKALVCLMAQDTDNALEAAFRSLEIAQRLGNTTLELNVLDTLGDIYLGREEPDQAIPYFRQSIALADVVGKEHGKLTAWLNMARAYSQQERWELALTTWQDALALAQGLAAKEEQRQCYLEMSRLHRRLADFEQALACHEKFHALDREVFNETADMRLKTLYVVHNTAALKKEAEIAHLQNVTLEKEIARRKQMEEALRESEERFRTLIEVSPDSIYFKDQHGRWLVANDAGLRSFALEGIAYQGKTDMELAELTPFFREAMFYCAQSDEKTWQEGALSRGYENIPQPDGSVKIFDVYKVPLFHADGRRRGIVVVGRDITEQKQAEELLRQAQKMESLGVLAGGVAHDFNNLLVAMLGQTSLALAKMRTESPARPHVEKAVNAAKRAADLTQKMLAYSGKGHFEVRPLNLNLLIEENLHLFEASIPKNVSLHSELADNLPLVDADAGQMQQVVMNLIINGAEAIEDRPGRLLVVTGVEEVAQANGRFQKFTAAELAPGHYVTLEVHDNGLGMDAETVTKIFDPFFSTKQTGHGLGLAAVSGIVRGHNGGIRVYSEVGQGTTFKLLFPVSQTAVTEAAAPKTIPDTAAAGSLVLVIDDEAPVREAVTDILELEKMQVMAAASGQEGIALYEQHMAEIDLVILDLSMPGLNGEETFHQLRQLAPNVKVILSSGYNQIEATRHFSGKGLAGFLQKPYNADMLLHEVMKTLDRPD